MKISAAGLVGTQNSSGVNPAKVICYLVDLYLLYSQGQQREFVGNRPISCWKRAWVRLPAVSLQARSIYKKCHDKGSKTQKQLTQNSPLSDRSRSLVATAQTVALAPRTSRYVREVNTSNTRSKPPNRRTGGVAITTEQTPPHQTPSVMMTLSSCTTSASTAT